MGSLLCLSGFVTVYVRLSGFVTVYVRLSGFVTVYVRVSGFVTVYVLLSGFVTVRVRLSGFVTVRVRLSGFGSNFETQDCGTSCCSSDTTISNVFISGGQFRKVVEICEVMPDNCISLFMYLLIQ